MSSETIHTPTLCPHCGEPIEIKITVDHAVVTDPDRFVAVLERDKQKHPKEPTDGR